MHIPFPHVTDLTVILRIGMLAKMRIRDSLPTGLKNITEDRCIYLTNSTIARIYNVYLPFTNTQIIMPDEQLA